MTSQRLTTLVVGYEDVEVALADLNDLAAVRKAHGVGDYEAAVVRNHASHHELVETTVDAGPRRTLLGAGLGVVVAVVITPLLGAAALGAAFGAMLGSVADQLDAFKHSDMREVERLVDDSAASLIIIADDATIKAICEAATSRHRRIVMAFSDADVDLLERELQELTMPPQGPG